MYRGSTSKFIMYPGSTWKFIMYPCSTCKQRGNGNKNSGSLCAAARSERFSRKHLFGVGKNVCRLPVWDDFCCWKFHILIHIIKCLFTFCKPIWQPSEHYNSYNNSYKEWYSTKKEFIPHFSSSNKFWTEA